MKVVVFSKHDYTFAAKLSKICNTYSDQLFFLNTFNDLVKFKNQKDLLIIVDLNDYTDNLESLLLSLNAIAEKYSLPVIVSTHPRTKDRLEKFNKKIKTNNLIKFLKPLGFFDYIKLQSSAYCVISDSGTITEESSILKFPAIMIRQAHERPEGMDEGTLIMSGIHKDRILESIEVVVKQYNDGKIPTIIDDYNVDNVSQKVIKIIFSYIDYVNRNVWRKDSSKKST